MDLILREALSHIVCVSSFILRLVSFAYYPDPAIVLLVVAIHSLEFDFIGCTWPLRLPNPASVKGYRKSRLQP